MCGVEFRLNHSDHRAVEEFLSKEPEGVAAIVVEAKNLDTQRDAIQAAVAAGVAVYVEPLTERLEAPGYSVRGLNYGFDVIDPANELRDTPSRAHLVERVLEPQLEVATAVTPPHFFVASDDALNLNVALAQLARQQFDGPVRPILAAQRTYLDEPGLAKLVAHRYLHEGISAIELRLSPLGDENDGPIKIRSVIQILEGFREAGMQVVLGMQGRFGETALALGLIRGFSAGIGYRERYDHRQMIASQQKEQSSSNGRRGSLAGVYLPGAAATVTRRVGRELYQNPAIRTRLMCRIGDCKSQIDGPAKDPRGHYMHARAAEVVQIVDPPEQWRPQQQRHRLARAIDLRQAVNKHLPSDVHPLKLRGLRTLVRELDRRMQQVA